MGKREKKRASELTSGRLKKALNPSVLGTAKQSGRVAKSGNIGSGRRKEGRGHQPRGGRAGKASRH